MRRIIGIGVLLLLTACSRTESESDENSPAVEASSTEAMSHELGPFFHAETEMNDRMAAAVGTNAADSWVRMMIEHHRGGVALSRIVLDQGPTEDVGEVARTTIEELSREIEELRESVREGRPDEEMAMAFVPPMERMHQAMMSAEGSDTSETWVHKMIEFHRGAVAMTDVLLARADVPAEIHGLAQRSRSERLQKVTALKRMLRGRAPAGVNRAKRLPR